MRRERTTRAIGSCRRHSVPVLSHPDCTVGPRVSPGQPPSGSRGVADCHRRWGIAPRPEDELVFFPRVYRGYLTARRSTAKEEVGSRLANCFISVATATASP